MVVDIAPQQQLPEVFSTNRNHHCSHKRNTTTINTTSSSNNNNNTMTNGHRFRIDELGKKADQILGHAPAVVDYCREQSIDLSIQHPPRLNIPVAKSQISPVTNSNQKNNKNNSVTIEQIVPLILKLVAPITYSKLPETISRNSKHANNIIEEMVHYETNLNLSDDENDDIDDENQNKIQHSDSEMENDDDETNRTNPHTLSLMDFIPAKQSPILTLRKRSTSPQTPIKRKEELIRSFSSSVNTRIDVKQPTLPITIPTHLFFDPTIKTEDDQIKPTKRYVNHDTTDNTTQQKKSKTSHIYKQEPTVNIKEEPDTGFSNDIPYTGNMATVAPMIIQPKKEKPTANVKPLLQSALMDNLSSTTNNSSVVNPPDRLTTTSNVSSRANYANLKNLSIKELNSLAREKKKQADGEKRTFEDVKQSMSLYLESVCYFIQCANDEPIIDQRNSLLKATLDMLRHLAYNYQKMFHIPSNQSAESLHNIRQKFILINYWLQSYIYHLQYNANFSSIERCANQVTEYFSHSKSPSDANHNFIYEFSKYMLYSYHSNYCWNKADRLTREEPLKKFVEQLIRQNQNRRLTRDDPAIEFLLYIFDAIDLLRLTNA